VAQVRAEVLCLLGEVSQQEMDRATGPSMSPKGLGCVKTPKLNLRTEISSRLQSI
jgi:hypothetical protein